MADQIKTFRIYLDHGKQKTILYQERTILLDELKKICFQRDQDFETFTLFNSFDSPVDPNLTLKQYLEKYSIYEVTFSQLELKDSGDLQTSSQPTSPKRETLSPNSSSEYLRSPDRSPMKLRDAPIPESPRTSSDSSSPLDQSLGASSGRNASPRVFRVTRTSISSNPNLGAPKKRAVFSKIQEDTPPSESPQRKTRRESLLSEQSETNEIDELKKHFRRRASSAYQSNNSCDILEEEANTTNRVWALPNIDEDPVSMSLTHVEYYTEKLPLDMKSFVYSEGFISAANIHDLFLRLIRVGDRDFVRIFLLTSDYFLHPKQLLQLFILYYRSPPVLASLRDKFREKILDLMNQWIKFQPYRDEIEEAVRNLWIHFLDSIKGNQEHYNLLAKSWQTEKFKFLVGLPTLTTKQNFTLSNLSDITEAEPIAVARQISLLEQTLFHRIPLHELCHLAWTKDGVRTPNLSKLIEQFNVVPQWVAATILDPVALPLKDRSKKILFWIKVLGELYELSNFNTLMQVFSALNMTEIDKLKAWKVIPKAAYEILETTRSLLDSNFKLYRAKIAEITTHACIPIYSVILRDLTMIEEMPTHLVVDDQTLVNWDKLTFLGNVLWSVACFQKFSYSFKEENDILQCIFFRKFMSDEKIAEMSTIIRGNEEKEPLPSKPTKFSTSAPPTVSVSGVSRRLSSRRSETARVVVEFVDLRPGTVPHTQFKKFLEADSKIEKLELYQALITFENQNWSPSELITLAEGICETYLGFGTKPACLSLPSTTQQQLQANKNEPTSKMFAAVKVAVLRDLEQAYKQFCH